MRDNTSPSAHKSICSPPVRYAGPSPLSPFTYLSPCTHTHLQPIRTSTHTHPHSTCSWTHPHLQAGKSIRTPLICTHATGRFIRTHKSGLDHTSTHASPHTRPRRHKSGPICTSPSMQAHPHRSIRDLYSCPCTQAHPCMQVHLTLHVPDLPLPLFAHASTRAHDRMHASPSTPGKSIRAAATPMHVHRQHGARV